MSQQKENEKLYPKNISQPFRQILLLHDYASNLTFQEAVQKLMSEDFTQIHYGLISIRKQIKHFVLFEEEIQDQQIATLITIIQQILQSQMMECLQFYSISILLQLLHISNTQLQLLIKQISFESLCQIYNRDQNCLFHVKIIIIFGLLSQFDETIAFQIYKCCHLQQRLDQITLFDDAIYYLDALHIFCKQMPQVYKNMTLDFIKKKFKIIKNPQKRACKIVIQIITTLITIENSEIDQQLLNIWNEIIDIWIEDDWNILESSVIQIISKFIKKHNFPKEKVEDQLFLDRLQHNLNEDSSFILFDSLQIYQYLIKQYQFCIASELFFKKLMQFCQNSQNSKITTVILKIIKQILKSKKLINAYLPKLLQFNIIRLLPGYLDEVIIIIEKINPCSHLSIFFKEKQKNELIFVNCILKIVALILQQNQLIDKFKTEIAEFERILLSQRCQTQLHETKDPKIQEKLTLIMQLLQNNKSFKNYEASDNKKIKIN